MGGAWVVRKRSCAPLIPLVVAGFVLSQIPVAARGGSPPAITVNGVVIGQGAVDAEFSFIENPKKMFHPESPERTAASLRDAVDRVIVWELVRQKLTAAGKSVTDREVEAAATEDRLRIGAGFAKYIAVLGQDETSYDKRKRNVLNFLKYVAEYITPLQQVSEKEIKERFEKAGTYLSPERYRAEYLQVYSPDPAGLSEEKLAAAAARARTLILGGASLEDAGKAVATPQIATRVGGGVYQTGRGPIYEQAVSKLQPGEVGEVLKVTNNSSLVPRLLERTPSRTLNLAEARPEIVKILQQEKSEQAIETAVREMKKKATIVYLEPRYAPKAE